MKPCPACGRRIQDAASKCHYCGVVVRPPRAEGSHELARPKSHAREQRRSRGLPLAFRIAIAILVFGAAMAWLVW